MSIDQACSSIQIKLKIKISKIIFVLRHKLALTDFYIPKSKHFLFNDN